MTERTFSSIIIRIFLFLLLFGPVLTACATQANGSDLSAQENFQVQIDFTITPLSPTSTSTTAPPSPTTAPSSTPTEEPTATNTIPPSLTPTVTVPSCTNQAVFVKHLSLSDNTALNPNMFYGKVWEIENTGTCTWNESYQLVLVSGSPVFDQSPIPLATVVAPGETTAVKVDFATSGESDTYTGNWMIQSHTGDMFGIGPNADEPLSTVLIVKRPTSPPPC
jgi:hypothetical protein